MGTDSGSRQADVALVTNVLLNSITVLHGCLRPPIALPQWQYLARVRATVRLGSSVGLGSSLGSGSEGQVGGRVELS